MYLVAIICPPLAVLICGKPIQAILNLMLMILLIIPAMIHAWAVVSESKAKKRNEELVQALYGTR